MEIRVSALVNSTGSSITCRCSLLSSPSPSNTDNGAVSFDLYAAGQTVVKSFVETWTSAGSLTPDTVTESAGVLVAVSLVGLFSVLFISLSFYLDHLQRDEQSRTVKANQDGENEGLSRFDMTRSGRQKWSSFSSVLPSGESRSRSISKIQIEARSQRNRPRLAQLV
jgi:hypothetical protein